MLIYSHVYGVEPLPLEPNGFLVLRIQEHEELLEGDALARIDVYVSECFIPLLAVERYPHATEIDGELSSVQDATVVVVDFAE